MNKRNGLSESEAGKLGGITTGKLLHNRKLEKLQIEKTIYER